MGILYGCAKISIIWVDEMTYLGGRIASFSHFIYVLSYTIDNFVDNLDKTFKNKRPFCLQGICPLYKSCTSIAVIVTDLQTMVHSYQMQIVYASGSQNGEINSLY